tara:strand:- start:516 stop:935 length:420 start_codon:yes stop_codon:yes gene_type:complete
MKQESQDIQSTKALKKRKPKSKKLSKGLGDTIEKVAEATGIKAIVEAVVDDCGCSKRKEALNKRFAYFNPMSEQDKTLWVETLKPFNKFGAKLGLGIQGTIIDLYQRVFNVRKKKTTCGTCVLEWLEKLDKAYEASCES